MLPAGDYGKGRERQEGPGPPPCYPYTDPRPERAEGQVVLSRRRKFRAGPPGTRPLTARVDVPLRHVLESIGGLDDLVHAYAMHALRHGVVVARGVEKDRRRGVGHQHLEIDVRRKPGLRVDGGATVLEVAVDQPPAPRVGEVQAGRVSARVPKRVLVRVRADVKRDERHLVVAPDQVFLDELRCRYGLDTVSYTHLRAHETRHDLVCRLLLEKKKNIK